MRFQASGFVFILILATSSLSFAQDDYYDDDAYADPYEDGGGTGEFEPPPPQDTGRPYVPPPPQRPKFDSGPRQQQIDTSTRSSSRSVDDPVEFRLVNPPKYWKPKPRKRRPPTRSS